MVVYADSSKHLVVNVGHIADIGILLRHPRVWRGPSHGSDGGIQRDDDFLVQGMCAQAQTQYSAFT